MRLVIIILIIVGLVVGTVVNFIDVTTLPSSWVIVLLVLAVIGTVGGAITQFFPQWLELPSNVQLSNSSTSRRPKSTSQANPVSLPTLNLPSLEKIWFRLGLMLLPLVCIIIFGFAVNINEVGFSETDVEAVNSLLVGVIWFSIFSGVMFVVTYYEDFASQREVLTYLAAGPIIFFEVYLILRAGLSNEVTFASTLLPTLFISFSFIFFYYVALPIYLRIFWVIKSFLNMIGLKLSAMAWFWLCLLSCGFLLFMGLFGTDFILTY